MGASAQHAAATHGTLLAQPSTPRRRPGEGGGRASAPLCTPPRHALHQCAPHHLTPHRFGPHHHVPNHCTPHLCVPHPCVPHPCVPHPSVPHPCVPHPCVPHPCARHQYAPYPCKPQPHALHTCPPHRCAPQCTSALPRRLRWTPPLGDNSAAIEETDIPLRVLDTRGIHRSKSDAQPLSPYMHALPKSASPQIPTPAMYPASHDADAPRTSSPIKLVEERAHRRQGRRHLHRSRPSECAGQAVQTSDVATRESSTNGTMEWPPNDRACGTRGGRGAEESRHRYGGGSRARCDNHQPSLDSLCRRGCADGGSTESAAETETEASEDAYEDPRMIHRLYREADARARRSSRGTTMRSIRPAAASLAATPRGSAIRTAAVGETESFPGASGTACPREAQGACAALPSRAPTRLTAHGIPDTGQLDAVLQHIYGDLAYDVINEKADASPASPMPPTSAVQDPSYPASSGGLMLPSTNAGTAAATCEDGAGPVARPYQAEEHRDRGFLRPPPQRRRRSKPDQHGRSPVRQIV